MRVLVIGLGSIARKHIAALRQIDGSVDVFALRSSKEAAMVEGVTNLYDWEQIGALAFDFALISNPTSEHIATIRRLIPYKMPLFIEKPLNTEAVDEALVEEVKSSGIITYIGCNLRFLECLQEAKKLVAAHRVNEVNIYCGSYLPDWRPEQDYRKVYSAIPELGGGVHIDLIHEMDYACWIYGIPQVTHTTFSNKSSLGIRAFDYANYLMEYPTFNVNVVLNYYRRDYRRTMEIVCEDTTYTVDLAKNRITQGDNVVFSCDCNILDTYLPQMRYFVDCVQHHRQSFNTVVDANNRLKISLGYDIKR